MPSIGKAATSPEVAKAHVAASNKTASLFIGNRSRSWLPSSSTSPAVRRSSTSQTRPGVSTSPANDSTAPSISSRVDDPTTAAQFTTVPLQRGLQPQPQDKVQGQLNNPVLPEKSPAHQTSNFSDRPAASTLPSPTPTDEASPPTSNLLQSADQTQPGAQHSYRDQRNSAGPHIPVDAANQPSQPLPPNSAVSPLSAVCPADTAGQQRQTQTQTLTQVQAPIQNQTSPVQDEPAGSSSSEASDSAPPFVHAAPVAESTDNAAVQTSLGALRQQLNSQPMRPIAMAPTVPSNGPSPHSASPALGPGMHSSMAQAPPLPSSNMPKFNFLNELYQKRLRMVESSEEPLSHLVRSRYSLLEDALRCQDTFYLTLHQVFCVWSANSTEAYAWIPLAKETIDSAFGLIGGFLQSNSMVPPAHLAWFAAFPCAIAIRAQLEMPFINRVALFLKTLARSWTTMYLPQVMARKYPLLCVEMRLGLQLQSTVLERVLFTSTRRAIGIRDGMIAEQMLHIFHRDQTGQAGSLKSIHSAFAGKPLPDVYQMCYQAFLEYDQRARADIRCQTQIQQPSSFSHPASPALPRDIDNAAQQPQQLPTPPEAQHWPSHSNGSGISTQSPQAPPWGPQSVIAGTMDSRHRHSISSTGAPSHHSPSPGLPPSQHHHPAVAAAPAHAQITSFAGSPRAQFHPILPANRPPPHQGQEQGHGQQTAQQLPMTNLGMAHGQPSPFPVPVSASPTGTGQPGPPSGANQQAYQPRPGQQQQGGPLQNHIQNLQPTQLRIRQYLPPHMFPVVQPAQQPPTGSSRYQHQYQHQHQQQLQHQGYSNHVASSTDFHFSSHVNSPPFRTASLSAPGTQTPAAPAVRAMPRLAGQAHRRATNPSPSSHVSSETALLPPRGHVIPLERQAVSAYDQRTVAMSLHHSHVRSPRRVPLQLPRQAQEPKHEMHYQYVKEIVAGPVRVTPGLVCHKLQFQVPEDVMRKLARLRPVKAGQPQEVCEYFNGSLRYRLRICVLPTQSNDGQALCEESDWVVAPTYWPPSTYVMFNDQAVTLRRKALYFQDQPAELTDMVWAGENTVTVSTSASGPAGRGSDYLAAVEMVETQSYSHIMDMVFKNGTIASDVTRGEIQLRLRPGEASRSGPGDGDGDDDDDEEVTVVDTSLSIDLADPFSATIFTIPARGATCTHLECFDLENWLETRSGKPATIHMSSCKCDHCVESLALGPEPSLTDKWKCPLCSKDARPSVLKVDTFMAEVRASLLEQGKSAVKSIAVSPDGKWTARAEPGDDDEDECRREEQSWDRPVKRVKMLEEKSTSQLPPDVEVIEID